MIFSNGEGVVSNHDGNVIAWTPLQPTDLNEFDIRQLFEQMYTSYNLLGMAGLDENDMHTWHLRIENGNIGNLHQAVKNNLITDMSSSFKKNGHSLCYSCVLVTTSERKTKKCLTHSGSAHSS